MTLRQIRTIRDERPFEPFDIHLADGRILTIRHPEFLAFSERSRIVIVMAADGAWEYVDPQLVVSLRVPAIYVTN